MSVRLILVAHAATGATRRAAFPADEPLEPSGAAKAAALAGTIGRVNAAWTSPALRAVQTAAALGLDAAVDPALMDIDLRCWSGRSLAEVQAADAAGLSRWMADPEAAPHGGESVADLLARVAAWMDRVSGREGRVLAVSHPAFIRAAILTVLDADASAFWRIDVEPLCFVTLLRSGSHWTLRGLG